MSAHAMGELVLGLWRVGFFLLASFGLVITMGVLAHVYFYAFWFGWRLL